MLIILLLLIRLLFMLEIDGRIIQIQIKKKDI